MNLRTGVQESNRTVDELLNFEDSRNAEVIFQDTREINSISKDTSRQ